MKLYNEVYTGFESEKIEEIATENLRSNSCKGFVLNTDYVKRFLVARYNNLSDLRSFFHAMRKNGHKRAVLYTYHDGDKHYTNDLLKVGWHVEDEETESEFGKDLAVGCRMFDLSDEDLSVLLRCALHIREELPLSELLSIVAEEFDVHPVKYKWMSIEDILFEGTDNMS